MELHDGKSPPRLAEQQVAVEKKKTLKKCFGEKFERTQSEQRPQINVQKVCCLLNVILILNLT